MKTAIVIMSDPKAGSDEATSRVLNALGYADEAKRSGDELAIVFAGTGTRWPAELAKISHPAHARYNAVREHVRGASRGCAMRNGAAENLQASGCPSSSTTRLRALREWPAFAVSTRKAGM